MDPRPHRLSVRTALFQGAERGSTPLGAMGRWKECEVGAVAQLVRVPVCHTGGRGFEPRQPRNKCSQHKSTKVDESQRKSRQMKRWFLWSTFVDFVRLCSTLVDRSGSSCGSCPGGEIGRHAILRGWCRKASRFESAPGHGGRQRSSVVEHSIRNRAVVGSIPTAGSL